MSEYHIAVLPGDGIGKEITDAAKSVLCAACSAYGARIAFSDYPIGKAAYDLCGDAFPPQTAKGIQKADAALMATPDVAQLPPPSVVGRLRRELALFADVRIARSISGAKSLRPDIDIVFIRDCTEGFLADRNLFKGYGEFMPTSDCVMSLRVLTGDACRKIAQYAYRYAKAQGRKKITIAHKKNVLAWGCGFFIDQAKEIGKDYPGIALETEAVDTVANRLVSDPSRYDVILTTNLFGDILSDVGSAIVDNFMPTGNIGDNSSVFSLVDHDPKYKEAGRDVTSPYQMLLCASMLLEHIGLNDAARAVERAIEEALVSGIKPASMGGSHKTAAITEEIVKRIR